MRLIKITIILLFSYQLALGQDSPLDTIEIENIRITGGEVTYNSVKNTTIDPQTAAIYSAVLPGLGQFYNNDTWKIPLIYSGFLTTGYLIAYNSRRYTTFRNALFAIIDNDPQTQNPYEALTETRLRSLVENYRRSLESAILFTGAWYALNIVDALVFAHLNEFDINENLSMTVQPLFNIDSNQNLMSSLNLTLRLR